MAGGGTRGGAAGLPARIRILYSAPAFAGAAMAIPIGVLMPRFYSDVVGAPLGAVAIAIAAARAFDALTDPVMGWVSDHTRTRWGRRKPWIALAAPFAAASFIALFAPPASLGPEGAAFWFAASFTLFFLFSTMLEIPYAALGAELSPDYRERSSLFATRAAFAAAGTIVASLLPTLLHAAGTADERIAFRQMALLYAALLLALGVGLVLGVPERRDYLRRPSNPLVPGVRRALRNRPFRILLLAGIVSAIPAAIPALLMPFYVRYVLVPEQPTRAVGLLLFVYLGAGLLFVPLWLAVARRVGKLPAFLTASAIGIAGSLLFFVAGPGEIGFAAAVYLLTGSVSMAGNFLVPSMAADVIDYDELRTGRRREAQYTSFWALIPKLVAIPGSSIPLAILAAAGYVPGRPQPEAVLFWIRFLYSLFPAGFYLAGWCILLRYPISEEVHRSIRRGIASRARGEAVRDPLTGQWLHPDGATGVDDALGWHLDHFSAAELRLLAERGAGPLRRRIGLRLAGAAAAAAAFGGLAAAGVRDLGTAPPLSTVLAVVGAGLSVTAAGFEALRLRAAVRLASQPAPRTLLRRRLAALGGASPAIPRETGARVREGAGPGPPRAAPGPEGSGRASPTQRSS